MVQYTGECSLILAIIRSEYRGSTDVACEGRLADVGRAVVQHHAASAAARDVTVDEPTCEAERGRVRVDSCVHRGLVMCLQGVVLEEILVLGVLGFLSLSAAGCHSVPGFLLG